MVVLNTAYAAPKNAADPKNRVGDFFYEDHASDGKNRWANRLNTQEKSCYHYETASGGSNWPNRDPIGEYGGLNLFAMVGNASVNYFDLLGLSCCGGSTLASGKQCCQNQQISASEDCCSKSDCRDKADDNYHDCLGRCDAAAAVIGAQGVVVGGALSISGVGAPIGIGWSAYSFLKGALVREACKRSCKRDWDAEKSACQKCGLS
jgi:hypothetical protein